MTNRADVEPHPDLAEEQAHIDRAYACLDAMRQRAVSIKSLGYMGGNVHAETGLTPEMAAYWDLDKQRRIDVLSDDGSALCFGRIDHAGGAHWHIGRRHVEDGDGAPVVTDWRARVAVPFYRATVADRMGLSRRRRFFIEERRLVDLLDEDLEHPSSRDAGTYVPDPLLAEVSRARTGEMRDIVATIQAEQDVIIRAPLEQCIIVQGGPGTGKTAVGLHRAAFLLYEHRHELERQRLLIVGPNRIFLRYIAQVLPSLGESASVQLTLEGLAGARYRVGLDERAEAARLKGDARMAEVLRRAVADRVSPPRSDITLATGFGEVTLAAAELGRIVENTLARGRRSNDGRAGVREQLVEAAWRAQASKPTTDLTQREVFEADLRASKSFKTELDRIWPTLTAAAVLRRLFGNRGALARASEGVLSGPERDLLHRKAAARASEQRWSRADLALLDELEDVIGTVNQSYGHIVVDEAQDLSAMELRMIARRSRRGSMTVLGDLAQASAPGAQKSWSEAARHLGIGNTAIDELTIGYRVPGPIMDFANRLLPLVAPGLPVTTSVRGVGAPPLVMEVGPNQVAEATAELAAEAVAVWTSVAVVVPPSLAAKVAGALGAAGVSYVDGAARAALGEHLTLLPPGAVKGLEFDAVIAVEPARMVSEIDNGLHLLYVVLTRAVQHLAVVHGEALPAALRPDKAEAPVQTRARPSDLAASP
ncbi:MAG TPA: AAA family ATPase [Acidimicrobiales bacterium]|nr:AAA family ATPase [Acidimicrobiales bacterium]